MNIGIKQIVLKSGSVVPIGSGITVLVGPNNVGKTRLLQELVHFSNSERQVPDHGLIASTLPFYRGDVDEAIEWLVANTKFQIDHNGTREFSFDYNQSLRESYMRSVWSTDRWALDVRPFIRLLDLDSRLNDVADKPTFSVMDGNFSRERDITGLQRLWSTPELVDRLNISLRDAFGESVSVPRDLGPQISVFMGSLSTSLADGVDAYRAELRESPRLIAQGHGLRAYTSLLTSIVTTRASILAIDEPEAFLHPPQARLLGQVLGQLRSAGMQIIVATHSPDVLHGLVSVSTGEKDLTIVRLDRDGDTTLAHSIPSETIASIVRSPLLRFSSILDGLFYRGTVICESGSDCLYYRAVLDALVSSGRIDARSADIHFAHCSGKDRIYEAVNALRASQVPVASVVDMDMLQDLGALGRLVGAHGGSLDSIKASLNTIQNQVLANTTRALRRDARTLIGEVLDGSRDDHLSPTEEREIRSFIRTRGGWRDVKLRGTKNFIGQSGTYRAVEETLAELSRAGVFVVPVGELESFHPQLDRNDKQRWLAQAIGQGLHNTNSESWPFIQSVVANLQSPVTGKTASEMT